MKWKDPKRCQAAFFVALALFVAGLVALLLPESVVPARMRAIYTGILAAGALATAVFTGLWVYAATLCGKGAPRAKPMDVRPEDVRPPIPVPSGAEPPVGAALPYETPAPEAAYAWKSDVQIWRGEWRRWSERAGKYAWVLEADASMPGEVRGTGRAFTALRLGLARLRGSAAEQAVMTGVSPAPGELYGNLEKGIAAVVARDEECIQGLVADAAQPVLAEKERLGEMGVALRRLTGEVARLESRLGELRGSDGSTGGEEQLEAEAAALAERAATLAGASGGDRIAAFLARLTPVVDAFEAAAYRLSVQGYYRQHGRFSALRRRLEADVLPLLAGAPDDEAARHYARELPELLGQMDTRLQRALAEVQHPGESLAGAGDLDLRVERLRVRAARLREGDPGYLVEQARPSVQEHLRPLVDTLVRDFLSPLLQEAAPAAGESTGDPLLGRVAAAMKRVLAETIELELIEPQVGDSVDDDEHEEVDVLMPDAGQVPDTVASVVEPGYRWAGELMARPKVRSYR